MPADVMKRLGAKGGSHAGNLHDHEAQLRERCKAMTGAECLGHEGTVRAGVDVLDDRIFFGSIKVLRPADDAPDIRLAVASLGDKNFGRLPAILLKLCNVRFFELAR